MILYITDKTGKKFWNTTVTKGFHQGELHNLQRHLANIKAGLKAYQRIDKDTARLVVEDEEPTLTNELTDEDRQLLKDLHNET